MPEMNGFESTTYIREILKSNIPIIALTADVTTADVEKCKSVGMDDYISKPIDERLLYAKIVGLVKNKDHEIPSSKIIEAPIKLKCIDLNYLIKLTKSNPIIIMEMIALYLEQTPPLIKAIKQSYKDKGWKELHSSVHKIIPSFSIVGIAEEFELMAKSVQEFANTQQKSEGIQDMVNKIEIVCNQACKELEIEYNKLKNNQ
jgi:CheY-like chemotaxis protein